MNKAHIRIHVQPRDYSTQYAQTLAIDLDSPLIADIMEPIERTIPFTGGPVPMLCENRRTAILGNRAGTANRLAHLFTQKILEAFEAEDTIDGYSRKEMKEMKEVKQYISPSQLHYIAKVYPEIIDEHDTEEYNKLEDASYWEVAARTINRIIDKKMQNKE